MSSSLYIVDYSEKAIALFGDTKPFKGKIIELGGKFNPSLKVENSEDRKAGWIFTKGKRKDVEKLLSDIESGRIEPQEVDEKSYSSSSSSTSKTTTTTKVEVSKADFMNLLAKVERLEQEVNNLKLQTGGKPSSVTVKKQKIPEPASDDDTEPLSEEEEKPRSRIMKKK